MYTLSVTDTFSAAHQLNGYDGVCKNLHGHNWKVVLTVECETLDPIGMALDFGILKSNLKDVLNAFDHQFLNALAVFQDCNPTSENLAKNLYHTMTLKLSDFACKVKSVEICESEKSAVVYSS